MVREVVLLVLAMTMVPSLADPVSSNRQLAAIKAEDQADRESAADRIDWTVVNRRDEARRVAVMALPRAGDVRTAEDHYNAALVFQHGVAAEDIRLAHALATTASTIDPAHEGARWLAAASWYRLMMRLKRPQWYGTQFAKRDGRWVLYAIDEAAVSDEERVRAGARTLQESRARADEMNQRLPPPPAR